VPKNHKLTLGVGLPDHGRQTFEGKEGVASRAMVKTIGIPVSGQANPGV
jgi:hypothetical protein